MMGDTIMRLIKQIILMACLLALSAGSALAAFNQWSGSGPFATGDGDRVITTVAVSPDGRALFAGSLSGTVFSEDLGYTVTVSIPAGPGNGTVTSDSGGINCSSNSQGTCSATYQTGATLTLSPATASGSTFTGWGQDCLSSGYGTCIRAMTADYTATAGFGLGPNGTGPMAKIVSGNGYDSITNAYSAAGAGAIILAVTGYHPVGTLTLDMGKDVTLKGGYDSLFQTVGLPSILQGVLDIRSGTMRAEGLRVKQ